MMSDPPTSSHVQPDVPLSPLTTIKLGGKARFFMSCWTVDQLQEALRIATHQRLRVHVLGGGSNVVFADEGFNGLVLRVGLKGVSLRDEGESVVVTAAAGEEWDPFVKQCIGKGLGGVECLSGIPGLVGATPIQNVGAYGQEVTDTIQSVQAIDRRTLAPVTFSNQECHFAYRQSRFKSGDNDKYIITEVTFRLRKNGRPEIRYPELAKLIASSTDLAILPLGEPVLRAVREAVLTLRRRKSMVLDPADPHSRSVGSFFTNPVLSKEQFSHVQLRWKQMGNHNAVPTFPSGENLKVPAAWLVENAGFTKGFRFGGVGVSQNHSLALVNYTGTSRELLELAARIQRAVYERFGTMLEREPVIVPA